MSETTQTVEELFAKFRKYLIESIEDQHADGDINDNLKEHRVALAVASHHFETLFRLAADIGWSLPLTIQVLFQSAGEDPNCTVIQQMDTWFKKDPNP
jgi:hypothetical protein